SNAAPIGGPTTRSRRSGWRSATPRTITASRRGVPNARTSPCASRASASRFSTMPRSSATARASIFAGVSPHPISSRRSAMGLLLLALRRHRARGRERARVHAVLNLRVERRLGHRALLLREQREAQRRAAAHVRLGARAREPAHAPDEALALGHADRA